MKRVSIIGLAALALTGLALTSCSSGPELKDNECLIEYSKAPETAVMYATFGPASYNSDPADTLRPVDNKLKIDFTGKSGDILLFVNNGTQATFFVPQKGGVIFKETTLQGGKEPFFEMRGNGEELSAVNKSLSAYNKLNAEFGVKMNNLRQVAEAAGEEKRDSIQKAYYELMDSHTANLRAFVKENANMAGAFAFLVNANDFMRDMGDLGAAIKGMPANALQEKAAQMVDAAEAVAIGKKFIDFELPTPEGKKIRLSDYAGKGTPVLLDFWASWCGPCRMDNPNLVKAYAKYHPKGFEIFAVSLDKDAESWKKAIKDDKLTWPQTSSLVAWECPIRKQYLINGIPNNLLLDGEGIIVAKNLHGEELYEKIEELQAK